MEPGCLGADPDLTLVCVTVDELLHFSMDQLNKGNDNTYLTELLWGLNELTDTKYLERAWPV